MKNRIFFIALVIMVGTAARVAAQAPAAGRGPAAPASNVVPFSQFKILMDRNIFDPNRRYDGPPPTSPVTTAPLPIEKIALQGIFINDPEAFAIFEGTNSQYNTSVAVGGIIAGHRVDAINTDKIWLAHSEKKFEMPIAAKLVLNNVTKNWEMTTDTTPLVAHASAPISPPSSSSYGSSDHSREGSSRDGGRDGYSRSSRYSSRGSSRDSHDSGSSRDSHESGSSQPSAPPQPAAAAPAAAGAPAPGGSPEDLLKQMMERRRKEMGS